MKDRLAGICICTSTWSMFDLGLSISSLGVGGPSAEFRLYAVSSTKRNVKMRSKPAKAICT